MVIKLVTFDGDGTLWDAKLAARRGLEAAIKMLVEAIPAASHKISVDMLQEIRDELASRVPPQVKDGGIEWGEKARHDSFSKALEKLGSPDESFASELSATYFSCRWSPNEVFSDVAPALEALRGKFMLGILTDGRATPSKSGLSHFFEFVITSPEVGSRKPGPEMFELAAGKAECEPGQMVHVGDSLRRDVGGARAFGARGIWLNRLGLQRQASPDPDAEVKLITDLPPILDQWNISRPTKAHRERGASTKIT